MSLFKIDSPVFQGLTRICDILILNILWVICSLPVITLGASTAALYYSMLKINREKDYGITEMFFHSFRQNLKQGSKLTVLFLVSGLFIYVDIRACKIMNGTISNIAMVLLVILSVIWGMMVSYVFPLLAQFDNTIINILKSAFIISINNFLHTIYIVVLNAIPFILFIGLPYVFVISVPIWLTFGVAVIAFMNAKTFVKIFDKYI